MAARSMLLLVLAIILVIAPIPHHTQATSIEFDIAPDDALAPDSDIIYNPSPSPDPEFLACASKITLDCAAEIIGNAFFPVHFEAKCCRQLIQVGKKCNGLLVDDILTELDNKRSYGFHRRSEHLWNRCLIVLDKN